MKPLTVCGMLALLTAFARKAFAQGTGGPADVADKLVHAFRSPAGEAVFVLAFGLVALRVYYAARRAVSVRQDARLGLPRGFLSGFFARVRLKKLTKQGRYDEAADLLQAHDPGRVVEAAELYIKARRYSRAAAILVANNRLRRAAETYVRAGAYDLAAELFERAEDLPQAETNYLRAGNKLAAARMLASAGKAERAARYFSDARRPVEAGEQLEGAGKLREAAEQYVEALALLERAGGHERGVHAGERDLGVDTMRDKLCDKILALYAKLGDSDSQVGLLVGLDRPEDAAVVLQRTGRPADAARLLVEHQLVDLAVKVLNDAHAGNTTRRKILYRAEA